MAAEKACKFTDTSHDLFVDEALETVWELREVHEGHAPYDALLRDVGNEPKLEAMKAEGLFSVEAGEVKLTERGERKARDIIRRHRLAERLFADVLDLKEYEEDACLIEHAISPSVEEAICTLLGHPPRCPHGKEIPQGKCCELFTRKVTPLTQSVRDMQVGRVGKVQFINAPAIDRLAAMGLVPGSMVKLVQKRPSYVIEIEETTVAIDEGIAEGIYVRPV